MERFLQENVEKKNLEPVSSSDKAKGVLSSLRMKHTYLRVVFISYNSNNEWLSSVGKAELQLLKTVI